MNIPLATRQDRGLVALAGLRIVVGLIFLTTWSANLAKGFYSPSGYAGYLRGYVQHGKLHFYGTILNTYVIPHAAIMARVQFFLELVVFGVFITLGFLTPVSSILAAGFFLNLLLASYGLDWPGTYVALMALTLAVAFSQSGRTLGVDALLARRNPKPRLPVY
jgi:uncharacterized membrane protein YphA (DoxX/SURF4 family)